MGKPTPKDEIPMQPHVPFEPFEKLGMDFVGPINSPSKQKQYIIVCTGYLKKWAGDKSNQDQGSQFTSNLIEHLVTHHNIKNRSSTPYHPQANGKVEVSNRALEGILIKVVSSSRKHWVDRLVEAIWAYNTTWMTTIGFTPYELVYGRKALLSIEFEFSTLRMGAQLDLDLIHA
eukprot:PITA_28541